MIPAFSHLDPGTDETVWAEHLGGVALRPFPESVQSLVVVAAHPDDETLGAAGVMQRVRAAGGTVTVVVATDGAASHPDSPTHTPGALARDRRGEVVRAVDLVAPGARLHFLGLPDGGLREHAGVLRTAMDGILDGLAASFDDADRGEGGRHGVASDIVVVAPWTGDGHRDHRIAGEIVVAACAARGLASFGYPIWLWHWGAPSDLPSLAARAVELSPEERRVKAAAIQLHTSQVQALSAAKGDEAVVHDRMRAHFERATEVFIAETDVEALASLDAAWFDEFYARNGDDPWGFETRWYEERKRSILLAALPTPELGATLEIGCSTGMVTEQLAARATSVIALDAAEAAVRRCRERVASLAHVSVELATVPRDWPEGSFDTIVLSEVGYYLSSDRLAELIDRMHASLSANGRVVAVHWRHPVAAYPQNGDDVHRSLRARPEWEASVRHLESDFVLEVFEFRPAVSVARRERLI
ncbi:PIG-L family deacetylase [Microbacterium sp. P03]|uniref:PIG-L family deacetylase n=1 Tax=Microbacterium sp. P03 TaxID=3366946 RepID=UPI003744CE23